MVMEFLPPRDIAIGYYDAGCFKSSWVFFFYKGKMKLIENDAVYVEVWIAAEGVKG